MEAIDLKQLRRNMFGITPTKKVCRSLFGEVDHDEVKKDLEREFKENLQQKSKLWNFDFGKYCPRDDVNGLKWTSHPAPITEYTIQAGRSLVTSFKRSPTLTTKTVSTFVERSSPVSSPSSQQTITSEKQQTSIKNFTVKADEETNVIEIINESPTRNITANRRDLETTATKLDISSSFTPMTYGKRKRGSQPKIDDFMKKKKSRMNVELTLPKSPRPTHPIASRLRSSPVVQIKV